MLHYRRKKISPNSWYWIIWNVSVETVITESLKITKSPADCTQTEASLQLSVSTLAYKGNKCCLTSRSIGKVSVGDCLRYDWQNHHLFIYSANLVPAVLLLLQINIPPQVDDQNKDSWLSNAFCDSDLVSMLLLKPNINYILLNRLNVRKNQLKLVDSTRYAMYIYIRILKE